MPNAIDILTDDHATVRRLLKRFVEAEAADEREELLDTITREVRTHAHIEEKVFYPAYRNATGKDGERQFHESLEEHRVVDELLETFADVEADGPDFAAKAKVLKELVEHHADEEEKKMFKQAKREMDSDHLQRLGERLEKEKKAFEKQIER